MSYILYNNIKAKSISYGGSRSATSIIYPVIHFTANKTSKAVNEAKYYRDTNKRSAGAHYFVDPTSVYESISPLKIAYAVGGSRYTDYKTTGGASLYKKVTNANSISIELCSTNGVISDATINNCIELLYYLKSKYPTLDLTKVCRHFDVTGKYCVPLYTEVLTKDGWKYITDINVGDEIVTAHIDNMDLKFDKVLNVIEPYKTRTYSMNGMTLTADHRVVYQTKIGRMYKIDSWREVMAKKQSYIPLCGQMSNIGIDISDNLIKLLVAIQADGCYEADGLLSFHFSKERKIERLKNILDSLDVVYREQTRSDNTVMIRIYDSDNEWFYSKYFEDRKLLNNKNFTYNLINLNKSQADIFLNELFYWDGSFTDKDEYFSKVKINCDVVSAIASCNEVKVTLSQDDKELWWVHFRTNDFTVGSDAKKEVKKDQMVTCVTVPSGIFLARQNGRIFITGNCPASYYDGKYHSDDKWIGKNPTAWNNFKAKLLNKTEDYIYQGVNYNKVFDHKFYADANTDLKALFGYDKTKLFNHFIKCGMTDVDPKTGKLSRVGKTIATFNVEVYASHSPDLIKAFGALSPKTAPSYYKHYCTNGYKEGRRAI